MMSVQNKTESRNPNLIALNPGDTVHLDQREAIFLGKWGTTCWYSFGDVDSIQGSRREIFKEMME